MKDSSGRQLSDSNLFLGGREAAPPPEQHQNCNLLAVATPPILINFREVGERGGEDEPGMGGEGGKGERGGEYEPGKGGEGERGKGGERMSQGWGGRGERGKGGGEDEPGKGGEGGKGERGGEDEPGTHGVYRSGAKATAA